MYHAVQEVEVTIKHFMKKTRIWQKVSPVLGLSYDESLNEVKNSFSDRRGHMTRQRENILLIAEVMSA